MEYSQMMLQEGGVKIWRPRQVSWQIDCGIILADDEQIYVGAGKRDYVPIEEREEVEGHKKTPSPIAHSGWVNKKRIFEPQLLWWPWRRELTDLFLDAVDYVQNHKENNACNVQRQGQCKAVVQVSM